MTEVSCGAITSEFDRANVTLQAKEIELVEKFVESCGDNLSIDLYNFSTFVEPKKSFTKQNMNELISTLKKTVYDGATRFDTLRSTIATNNYDCFLLFSDGITSLGDNCAPLDESAVGTTSPIYAFGASTGACDHNFLRLWAYQTGGVYFNLQSKSTDIGDIVKSIGKPVLRLVSVRGTSDNDVEQVYPPTLTPVASTNNHYVVVGQLRAKETEVTVNYGFGLNDVRVTKKYKLNGNVTNTGKITVL